MEERLVTFLTVAQLGSFQNAAAALGVAPSTVTERVRRLEAELGCELLRRLPRALQVTDAGRAFLLHTQRILAAYDEGRRAVDAVKAASATGVRVVFSTVPAFRLLPQLGRSGNGLGPWEDASSWMVTTSKRAFRALLEGKADVGVVSILFRHPDLETELLAEERYQLVASPDVAASATIDHDGPEPQHRTLLYFREGLEDALRAQAICAQIGWPTGCAKGVSDLGVLLELLYQGRGVGVVQESVVSPSLASGRLQRWNGPAVHAFPRLAACLLVRRAVASEERYAAVERLVGAVRMLYAPSTPDGGGPTVP